jgi:hypothetical protein
LEITSSGAVQRRLDSTFSKPSPDRGCCDENRGNSPVRAQGRSIRRSLGKMRGKRLTGISEFRYSVYSVKVRFWRNLENSVVLYGQDVRNGRRSSLFTNDVQNSQAGRWAFQSAKRNERQLSFDPGRRGFDPRLPLFPSQ